MGSTQVRPIIGEVKTGSLAYQAGLSKDVEIISIDGNQTSNWLDVSHVLLSKIGATGIIQITVRNIYNARESEYLVVFNDWLHGAHEPNLLQEFGITPWSPTILAVVDKIYEQSPAQQAGLQVGDKIVGINEVQIIDWMQMLEILRPMINQEVRFSIEREGQVFNQKITLSSQMVNNVQYSYLGVGVKTPDFPEQMLVHIRDNPVNGLLSGVKRTFELSVLTVQGIYKLLTGALSVKNLSGPITIAKISNTAIKTGISSFLFFLAYLSISLGVLNLLPIPLLDGGHFFFYVLEVIRGKSLSDRTQNLASQVGMFLIMSLIFIALFNDLSGLVS